MTTDMYNLSFPHSRLITGFVTRVIRRVPLVEQELLTLPEHLSSPPVFSLSFFDLRNPGCQVTFYKNDIGKYDFWMKV